jgi:hypothetical protein
VNPLGRIKVRIPGMMEETSWAYPSGWGRNQNGPVPPLGEMVEVFFIAGRRDSPRWRPSHPGEGETFPEFVHPDMTVMGDDNLRIIRDPRGDRGYTCIRAMEKVNGVDDVLVEIFISHEGRALRIYAGAGMKIESEGELSVDSSGDVDVQGRKVLPRNKPIT